MFVGLHLFLELHVFLEELVNVFSTVLLVVVLDVSPWFFTFAWFLTTFVKVAMRFRLLSWYVCFQIGDIIADVSNKPERSL